jgi:hypothetical protein
MPGLDVGELVSGDPAGRAHPCNATLLARQTACGEATESSRLGAWVDSGSGDPQIWSHLARNGLSGNSDARKSRRSGRASLSMERQATWSAVQ